MRFEHYLGIDPGKTGGMALINDSRAVLATTVMGPIDQTINWLRQLPITGTLVLLEKAQAMPKNGAVSMFNYGLGYGEIIGALTTLNLPFMTIPPSIWTKVMHQGIPKALDAKERSLKAFLQLFPGLDFRATAKCKKHHEGLIDAVLLAEYGRLRHQGLNG